MKLSAYSNKVRV